MTVPGGQAGRQAAIWFTTQAMWVPSNGTGVDDGDNYGIAISSPGRGLLFCN
jgi:hypothetical protein